MKIRENTVVQLKKITHDSINAWRDITTLRFYKKKHG